MKNRQSLPMTQSLSHNTPLFDGIAVHTTSFSGLAWYYGNGHDKTDDICIHSAPSGVWLLFLLGGQTVVSFNERRYILNASDTSGRCYAVASLTPLTLERHLRKGRYSESFHLTLPLEKLISFAGTPVLQDQLDTDKPVIKEWAIDQNCVQAIRQITDTTRSNMCKHISSEQVLLGLLSMSIKKLAQNSLFYSLLFNEEADNTQKQTAALTIRDKVQSILEDENTPPGLIKLSYLAKQLNMSVSKMQRLFKEEFGQTVASYTRRHRLEQAYRKLQVRQVSIGEAAYFSGYRHTSNFTSAFKHAFGITPGELVNTESR